MGDSQQCTRPNCATLYCETCLADWVKTGDGAFKSCTVCKTGAGGVWWGKSAFDAYSIKFLSKTNLLYLLLDISKRLFSRWVWRKGACNVNCKSSSKDLLAFLVFTIFVSFSHVSFLSFFGHILNESIIYFAIKYFARIKHECFIEWKLFIELNVDWNQHNSKYNFYRMSHHDANFDINQHN